MNDVNRESEINLLSDDELDAVAGGARNIDNPVVVTAIAAFVHAANLSYWAYAGRGC